MNEQINVSAEAVLSVVTAQRDKAMTDLAVAQAACRQMAERVRQLEAAAEKVVRRTGTD